MKAGIQGQEQGLILHLLERLGCTTPVGLNFLADGLSALEIPWADGHTRWTRLFIGGVMEDQQEGDRYTVEPCVCHRFFAHRHQYLDTADFEERTMRKVSARVEFAAAGGQLKGSRGTWAVRWDPHGCNVTAGPGIIHIICIMSIIHIKCNICIIHIFFLQITCRCKIL